MVRASVLSAAVFLGSLSSVFAAGPAPAIKASVVAGYDNNAHLNAERKSDGFMQEAAGIRSRHELCDVSDLRLSYDVLNLNYFDATDESFLWQRAGAGVDWKLLPGTTVETDYAFRFVYFPDDEDVTYYLQTLRSGVRQDLSSAVTVRGGFGAGYRAFDSRKKSEPNALLSDEDERADRLYEPDAELSVRLTKSLYWRTNFSYLWQDSNAAYNDYYDYEALKVRTALSAVLSRELSASVEFGYESRDYDSRTLFGDATRFESADIYSAGAALFYRVNKNFSLGTVYTYRQKNSNEPSETYSGSIGTLGVYSSF